MHEFQALSSGRIERVLEERLRPAIHSHRTPLRLSAHVVGGEPISVADGLAADYRPFAVGSAGGARGTPSGSGSRARSRRSWPVGGSRSSPTSGSTRGVRASSARGSSTAPTAPRSGR
nr:hypothetical protein [Propioniciclava coleopterorum]